MTLGELGGLLCNYLDACVPRRMHARTAGAHLAAIKANLERRGLPDPTARATNPIVRNTLDGAARRVLPHMTGLRGARAAARA